jgi:hypothetical protein
MLDIEAVDRQGLIGHTRVGIVVDYTGPSIGLRRIGPRRFRVVVRDALAGPVNGVPDIVTPRLSGCFQRAVGASDRAGNASYVVVRARHGTITIVRRVAGAPRGGTRWGRC